MEEMEIGGIGGEVFNFSLWYYINFNLWYWRHDLLPAHQLYAEVCAVLVSSSMVPLSVRGHGWWQGSVDHGGVLEYTPRYIYGPASRSHAKTGEVSKTSLPNTIWVFGSSLCRQLVLGAT